MKIKAYPTEAQVLVKAYTTLEIEGLELQVRQRTARIKRARVYWGFFNGQWQIDFVSIWGPVIRKSDGAESSQHVSENTHVGVNNSYQLATPPEIVEAAMQNLPQWIPEINECPYPRVKDLKTSL